MLDSKLHSQFSALEDQLIDAVVEGRAAMQRFVDRLSSLHRAATSAMSTNSLSSRTLSLLRNVALTGSALAENARHIEPFTREIDDRRQADISDVFQRMTLNDSDHPSLSSQLLSTSDETSSEPTHILNKWIFDNIHYPYAPSSVKAQLSKQTGMSVPSVSNYLVQLRQRVGWTRLVKQFFNKDRVHALDCAQRVFLNPDPNRPVDESLVQEFLSIKRHAKEVCQKKGDSSEIARQIEGLMKEVPSSLSEPTKKSARIVPHAKRKRDDSGDCEQRAAGVKDSSRPSKKCRPTQKTSGTELQRECESRKVPFINGQTALCGSQPHEYVESHGERLWPGKGDEDRLTPYFPQTCSSKRRLPHEEDGPHRRKRHRDLYEDDNKRMTRSLSEVDSTLKSPGTICEDGLISRINDSPSTSLCSTPDLTTSVLEDSSDQSSEVDEPYLAVASSSTDSQSWDPFFSLSSQSVPSGFPTADSSYQDYFIFPELVDLPEMPTFTSDGFDILPPSLEPFPSLSELFISCPGLSGTSSHCSHGPSFLDNSQFVTSLGFNTPTELQINVGSMELPAMQIPGSDIVSSRDHPHDISTADSQTENKTAEGNPAHFKL